MLLQLLEKRLACCVRFDYCCLHVWICFMSVDTSSAISILLNVNNDSMLKTI